MQNATSIEGVLKRDRVIVVSGLAGISFLAWAYMFYLTWDMRNTEMHMQRAMSHMQSWGGLELVLLFLMWAVMMVAMMVPSVSPIVLMFATTNRRLYRRQGPFVPTSVFLLGYLVLWTGFSALVTLVQWGLHSAALLSPMMMTTSPILGGALLLTAGIFQCTPLKNACLRHCRSPIGFLMTEWREGTWGAFLMGLRHGAYCTGCCWALMSLLFVTGVMNLLWIAIIAAFVLAEKVIPGGDRVGRAAGVPLIGYGTWMSMRLLFQ